MELNAEDIRKLLQTGFGENDQITVEGGGGKFQATIVSSRFEGLSRVKRHQLVYRTVNPQIESGALHALAIQALAPAETAN